MTSPPSFPSSLLPLISTRHPTFKFCYAKNSFRDFYLAALRVSICSYTQPPFPPSLLELGSFENFPHFVLFQLWLQMMYNPIWWFIASNILIEWVSVCMSKLSAIWSFFIWCFVNAFESHTWSCVPGCMKVHWKFCAEVKRGLAFCFFASCSWMNEVHWKILCRTEEKILFKSFLCLVSIQMFT